MPASHACAYVPRVVQPQYSLSQAAVLLQLTAQAAAAQPEQRAAVLQYACIHN
jgi:hypothetical protein